MHKRHLIRVDWKSLCKFGFGTSFDRIRKLYTPPSASVRTTDQISPKFNLHISPSLFAISIGPLAVYIRQSRDIGLQIKKKPTILFSMQSVYYFCFRTHRPHFLRQWHSSMNSLLTQLAGLNSYFYQLTTDSNPVILLQSGNIKYLGINISSMLPGLSRMNFNPLLKTIEDYLTLWKKKTCPPNLHLFGINH